jgi:outer membrane biosynthesis protein TonB
MFRLGVFALVAAVSFASVSHSQVAPKPTEVSSANANEHILKKSDPEYPPLARAARLQGKVLLTVIISKDGDVTTVSVVSGHPMLIPSTVVRG